MRFTALLKKELRECLPWLLTATVIFLLIGTVLFQERAQRKDYYPEFPTNPGSEISAYEFTGSRFSRLDPQIPVGPLLFVTSIGLGLSLAGRGFWMPGFSRTWSFTVHRSVGRMTILTAKICAACISFVIGPGLVWMLFYWYASRPGISLIPPRGRVFIEGWILIATGLIVYAGAALSGLSSAKWYTTKMFGLGFSLISLVFVILQRSLPECFIVMIIGFSILLPQIINTFLKKEL